MKALAPVLFLMIGLAFLPGNAEEDWVTFYYLNPTPDRFVEEVKRMAENGILEDENSRAPVVSFLSRVMAANPDRVENWMKELYRVDEGSNSVILLAGWYSGTEGAERFFRQHAMQEYQAQPAPKILEMEVDSPSVLDMLWGYFMATGEREPIERIVSALSLSRYNGAIERFKTSEKTEQDEKEAYLDVTFQSAMWSLESNCRQHSRVLEHCETIFAGPELPSGGKVWLAVVLSKVLPEKYRVGIGEGTKAGGNEE